MIPTETKNPAPDSGRIDRILRSLPRAAVRRPCLTIAVMLALVLAAAPGLARLRLRTDGHALVPPDDPAVTRDASIRRHFDLRDPIVVFIRADRPGGIYDTATLRSVVGISEALAAFPEVGPDHVMSLATERRDRVYPGTLKFRPFLDPLPETPADMELLRSDVEAAGILIGTLVSADGRSTAVLVGSPPASASGDRVALYRRILATAESLRANGDRVVVVGAPVAEALLGTHLLSDLTRLVPLSILLIASLVWVGCGRLWGVVLALVEVGACLLWTFGTMGWTGSPVYLTIAVLPVILTTLGLADEIHIFWHYQVVLEEHGPGNDRGAVVETMDRMARPVVLTSLSTAIGFLSFLVSPIVPVRAFGAFAAAGILFCMLWSLTVIPAALALVPSSRMRRRTPRFGGQWLGRAIFPVIRRRRLTLSAVLVLTVLALVGLRRLYVQDSWIGGFAPDSPFRRATELVNAQLLGTHLLLVHLAFEERDGNEPLLNPSVLDALGEFEGFLRARPGVGGVLGPRSHLAAVHYLSAARRVPRGSLPGTTEGLKRLIAYFDKVRGAQRRRQIIDDSFDRTVVTVFLKDANYRDTARLMEAIRDYAGGHLAPLGARLSFGGDVAVSQAMIPAIVRTQVASLALAFGMTLVMVALLLRSMRRGLYAVFPAAIAALWVFGAMGWSGIPLGVATSMFCAITLGVGVDYAIHLVEAVRRNDDRDPAEAVRAALTEAGPAIVVDALAISLGFGLLAVSSVPANARLGILVALALIAGCVLTLGGLGALMTTGTAGTDLFFREK